MKLGTVVYNNKIYNLDYMSAEEMKDLKSKIQEEQKLSFKEAKKMLTNINKNK